MIADDPKQWSTPSKWIDFNINERVRVKLTDIGVAEYRRQREDLNACLRPSAKKLSTEPVLDVEGYYTDQLWSLMRDFGHMISLGAKLPFHTVIQVKKEDLRPVLND